MWEFIVSGRLPGTAIQVTFENWLYAMAGLVVCVMLYRALQRRLFSRLLVKALVLYAVLLVRFDSQDLTT